jgi:hypothetical protein
MGRRKEVGRAPSLEATEGDSGAGAGSAAAEELFVVLNRLESQEPNSLQVHEPSCKELHRVNEDESLLV